MQLEAGAGRVITLTAAAASVFAADPKVVEVRPASPTTCSCSASHPATPPSPPCRRRPADRADGRHGRAERLRRRRRERPDRRAMPGLRLSLAAAANGLALNGMAAQPGRRGARHAAIARAGLPGSRRLDNRTASHPPSRSTCASAWWRCRRNLTRELGVNWQALANVGGRYGTLGFSSAPALIQAANTVAAAATIQQPASAGHQQRDRRAGAGPAGARAGRAEPHGDERRDGELPGRRRVPDPGRAAATPSRSSSSSTASASPSCRP